MFSKIYFGRVQHRRFSPRTHEFSYGLFMLYLDLDELPSLFKKYWLWSLNKWNLASFFNDDYLTDERGNIKQAVVNKVVEEFGVAPNGPIRMLTHLRYFGHCFNPVTFYYCFNENDTRVEFVVAEINNTPWNQRYCYVLDNRNNKSQKIESYFSKNFHVSPFLPMDMLYRWRFSIPNKKLNVLMQNFSGNSKIFDANLRLVARPVNSLNLARALIQFPLMSWQVTFGIYWQAFRLWLKKIPFFSNPEPAGSTVMSTNSENK